MEILDLNSFSGNLLISMSSITREPSLKDNLKSASIKDDLPAPVLPMIPTYNKTCLLLKNIFQKWIEHYFFHWFNVNIKIF